VDTHTGHSRIGLAQNPKFRRLTQAPYSSHLEAWARSRELRYATGAKSVDEGPSFGTLWSTDASVGGLIMKHCGKQASCKEMRIDL